MDLILTTLARSVAGLIRMLPLKGVARLGRFLGALVHLVDARHRKVATKNLHAAFPEKSAEEVKSLVQENFRRIGENFACAVKTAYLPRGSENYFLSISGVEKLRANASTPLRSRVVAIGHFGNFELYARISHIPEVQGYQFATTYRGLPGPRLNRFMQEMRERSGCRFFERRSEAGALKAAFRDSTVLLGLLADQHAGRRGVWVPFFGRECSTSPAPAVLALRYDCPLQTAFCYRVGLGKWQIELGDEIPVKINGEPRPVEEVALEMNQAFEKAIRRDPANWFWVHNRWKSVSRNSMPSRRKEPENPNEIIS